jgi:glycosyltransferase involved in cell wall biosynthesis
LRSVDAGDAEIIVVDDGSTEDLLSLVPELKAPHVRYLRQENAGATKARNLGARHAQGRYLTFLDSDDEATPGWLQRFIHAFEQTPSPSAVCCGVRIVGKAEGRRLPSNLGPAFSGVRGLFTQSGTYALDRAVFASIGGFDDDMPASQHTELALRLVAFLQEHGGYVAAIDDPGILYHQHDGASIRKNDRAVAAACARLLAKHGARLALDSGYLANTLATGGVRAIRSGQMKLGQEWLWRSARLQPSARNIGRALTASIPTLARAAWPPTRTTP